VPYAHVGGPSAATAEPAQSKAAKPSPYINFNLPLLLRKKWRGRPRPRRVS